MGVCRLQRQPNLPFIFYLDCLQIEWKPQNFVLQLNCTVLFILSCIMRKMMTGLVMVCLPISLSVKLIILEVGLIMHMIGIIKFVNK